MTVEGAQDDGVVAEDSPSRQEMKGRVPQPLLASLSLRDSWLLPGALESWETI